jgi:hypothetical protein
MAIRLRCNKWLDVYRLIEHAQWRRKRYRSAILIKPL